MASRVALAALRPGRRFANALFSADLGQPIQASALKGVADVARPLAAGNRAFAHSSASSSGRQTGASPLAGSGLGAFAAVVASVTALATLSDLPGLQRYLRESKAPKKQPNASGDDPSSPAAGNAAETTSGGGALQKGSKSTKKPADTAVDPTGQAVASAFRVIPRAEVEQHASEAEGIWVTFGEGVYDVTSFVSKHPGGNKILMAAGGALEPYWAMYAQHKQPAVMEMLNEMRIGTLPEHERSVVTEDPYATDPARSERIVARSTTPFNGEAPLDALLHHITPEGEHYIRNHMPVPDAVQAAYELQIVDANGDTKTFTLDDLKSKYPKVSVTTTLQCAGNRRSEMDRARKVNGLFWRTSISTAEWSGARLSDILKELGAQPGEDARHVQFVGLDCDMSGERYGASVPIQKALSDDGDCILAYEMNGQPIPRDHGFPVRAVIPGHVAARSVKWLDKVVVSDEESESHWQQRDYKGFCPDEDWDHLDWSKAPAIQEQPITSAILSPTPDEGVSAPGAALTVKGYAVAGGGREVIRVDVSGDGGKTWKAAELLPEGDDQGYRRHWAWRHWQAEVPVPKDSKGGVTLVCKAVDDSYNVQPDTFEPIYNARGVLSNAWHRVEVPVKGG